MGEKKRNLREFRKICGKCREEMWEIKKIHLGESSSNLCQGLDTVLRHFLPNFRNLANVRHFVLLFLCIFYQLRFCAHF